MIWNLLMEAIYFLLTLVILITIRIIEVMEKEGVIGPADGAKPREVLARNSYS